MEGLAGGFYILQMRYKWVVVRGWGFNLPIVFHGGEGLDLNNSRGFVLGVFTPVI